MIVSINKENQSFLIYQTSKTLTRNSMRILTPFRTSRNNRALILTSGLPKAAIWNDDKLINRTLISAHRNSNSQKYQEVNFKLNKTQLNKWNAQRHFSFHRRRNPRFLTTRKRYLTLLMKIIYSQRSKCVGVSIEFASLKFLLFKLPVLEI